MRALVLLPVVAFFTLGCGGPEQTPGAMLQRATTSFLDDMRWQRYDEAARHIPHHRRRAWITAMTRASRVLRIDEYRIQAVHLTPGHADIEVELTYHRADDPVVRRMLRRQVWKQVQDLWTLVADEPMPTDRAPPPSGLPQLDRP